MSKSESRQLDSTIKFRVDAETKRLLKEKASTAGLSLSQYLIRSGLGRRMVNKSDTKMLATLNKLGALQKHLFLEGKRTGDKEYSEVLSALTQTAKMIMKQSNPAEDDEH